MKTKPSPPAQAVFRKVAENLYRLESSGTYYALFKRAGKQIRRSLKTSDAALARRRLNDLRDKVARLSQTKGTSKLTFGTLAERWLTNHRAHLKEKSISRLDTCLEGLNPYFGHVPIRNISSRQCEAWINARGVKISPASYKHERRVLLSVLDFAMRDGLILDNPARVAVPIRKVPKAKIVIPTRDQFTTMVATIRKADIRAKPAGDLVELLGYTGMRLGKAVNLTWGDVDWDRNSFTVTGGERLTKNHEVRVVPMFPALRELLERLRGDKIPAPTEKIKSIMIADVHELLSALSGTGGATAPKLVVAILVAAHWADQASAVSSLFFRASNKPNGFTCWSFKVTEMSLPGAASSLPPRWISNTVTTAPTTALANLSAFSSSGFSFEKSTRVLLNALISIASLDNDSCVTPCRLALFN